MQLHDDNRLDALLRENDSHIDDDGFTARVMASLPPRRQSRLRPVILGVATLLGLALLIWFFPSEKEAFNFNADGHTIPKFNLESVLTLLVLLLSSASLGWGLVKALQQEE